MQVPLHPIGLARITTDWYAYMASPPSTPSTQAAMDKSLSRRDLLRTAAAGIAALATPVSLSAFESILARRRFSPDTLLSPTGDADEERLAKWLVALRAIDSGEVVTRSRNIGQLAARVGELAVGTPYKAFTLEAYLRAGGNPTATEPLTLSLTQFDCVSLVEACLAVARVAGSNDPCATNGAGGWSRFAREIERMRYRDGMRTSYASRLHYFSEWMSDGARRGLLRDLGAELGGVGDNRPLRFMTEHRASYPALADDDVFRAIGDMEKSLDRNPRRIVPAAKIPGIADQLESGDVLGFATSIPGLDVSHAAFAYRGADRVLRVLHAPLSGGAVEITKSALPAYVAGIRRSTGIIVARPLSGSGRTAYGDKGETNCNQEIESRTSSLHEKVARRPQPDDQDENTLAG